MLRLSINARASLIRLSISFSASPGAAGIGAARLLAVLWLGERRGVIAGRLLPASEVTIGRAPSPVSYEALLSVFKRDDCDETDSQQRESGNNNNRQCEPIYTPRHRGKAFLFGDSRRF
jgi:hypothetical protein